MGDLKGVFMTQTHPKQVYIQQLAAFWGDCKSEGTYQSKPIDTNLINERNLKSPYNLINQT